MPSNLAEVFTTTLDHESLEIPDGVTEIFMNNVGDGDATWTGNKNFPTSGVPSEAVTLPAGNAFSYGYIGRGRKGFLLDASDTILELSLTF